MKPVQTALFSALLVTSMYASEPFYTQEGTGPSFADIIKDGIIKPGEGFSKVPVLGSAIKVNHALLEKQIGKSGPIPKDAMLFDSGVTIT